MTETSAKAFYAFQCNRCPTSAHDTSRAGVELFAEHHVRTMHPLFTAESSRLLMRPPAPRRLRTSRPASSPLSRRLRVAS